MRPLSGEEELAAAEPGRVARDGAIDVDRLERLVPREIDRRQRARERRPDPRVFSVARRRDARRAGRHGDDVGSDVHFDAVGVAVRRPVFGAGEVEHLRGPMTDDAGRTEARHDHVVLGGRGSREEALRSVERRHAVSEEGAVLVVEGDHVGDRRRGGFGVTDSMTTRRLYRAGRAFRESLRWDRKHLRRGDDDAALADAHDRLRVPGEPAATAVAAAAQDAIADVLLQDLSVGAEHARERLGRVRDDHPRAVGRDQRGTRLSSERPARLLRERRGVELDERVTRARRRGAAEPAPTRETGTRDRRSSRRLRGEEECRLGACASTSVGRLEV